MFFSPRKFRIDFDGQKNLRLNEESKFTFKIPRYADLLMDTYLVLTIPDIWSPLYAPVTDNNNTWAPYNFASYFQDGPGLNSNITNQVKMANVNSVDIIFTNDQTKWSRAVIVEAQENPDLAIGGALKMGLRESPSVDKTGADDGTGTNGMGWFPGYAIDIETGERLNIVFAEDSWLTSDNGNDMKWNPTSNLVTEQFPFYDNTSQETSGGNYLLGGKHFVYVINGKSWVKGTQDYINGDYSDVDNSPNYDEGTWIYNQLKDDVSGVGKWKVFKNSSYRVFKLAFFDPLIENSYSSPFLTCRLLVLINDK